MGIVQIAHTTATVMLIAAAALLPDGSRASGNMALSRIASTGASTHPGLDF